MSSKVSIFMTQSITQNKREKHTKWTNLEMITKNSTRSHLIESQLKTCKNIGHMNIAKRPNNAFVVIELVETLARIEPCSFMCTQCTLEVCNKSDFVGCISVLHRLSIPYHGMVCSLCLVLYSVVCLFLPFFRSVLLFHSFFQSRVTLECVYDLKPRYV